MKTNRRWLKSAIAAASCESVILPWAQKRVEHPAAVPPAPFMRIIPSAPTHYAAIAAR